jgi:hypothetical protein
VKLSNRNPPVADAGHELIDGGHGTGAKVTRLVFCDFARTQTVRAGLDAERLEEEAYLAAQRLERHVHVAEVVLAFA